MTTTGENKLQKRQQSLPFVALPKATITDNALVYNDQPPTFEEWQAHGTALQKCSGAALWWVGDWFVWGEQQFGEKAYQAVGDYEPETVRKAVWVASRVSLGARRPNLPFTFHQEVAPLDPAAQEHWLAVAESHAMTRQELRASIKAGRVMSQAEIDAQKTIAPALVDVELVFHGAPWQRFVKQQWVDRNKASAEEKRRWLEALREPARMAAELEKELAG
jgi:hypothetical protein